MIVLSTILFAAQSLRYVKLSNAANVIKVAAKVASESVVVAPVKTAARRVQPISFKSKAKFE